MFTFFKNYWLGEYSLGLSLAICFILDCFFVFIKPSFDLLASLTLSNPDSKLISLFLFFAIISLSCNIFTVVGLWRSARKRNDRVINFFIAIIILFFLAGAIKSVSVGFLFD